LAQAVHAAFHASVEWPSLIRDWVTTSNFLVVVAVPDEQALVKLAARAVEEGILRYITREPDLNDSITAVALQPGDEARRLCANFPLALKQTSCWEVFTDTDGYPSMRSKGEGVHA
jgi:hypothetical protein